jgi:hypothetical protein
VGKFRAPAFFCRFEKPIFEAMDLPLPYVDGVFTRKAGTANKVVFSLAAMPRLIFSWTHTLTSP